MPAKPCLGISFLLMLAGCAVMNGKPAVVSPCSFEQIWDTAIVALAGLRLQTADKANRILETEWVEVESGARSGIFQREVNKERLKYLVEINQDGPGTTATVTQRREEFSPMGVKMRQWRAVPGNLSEEAAVAGEISRRLKEKGC